MSSISKIITGLVVILSATSVLTLLLPSNAEVLHFVMVTAAVVPAVVMVAGIPKRTP